ncbi:MAG: AI-2E family transporter [Acidobacteriaceae bacterium]|nr:AI-2E family transporter [Acidobacteriaceae bacterium]
MAILSPPYIPQKTFGFGRALIAIAALIALLYFGRDFFVTLIISAVFAFILDPVVVLFTKLRLPRAVATGIVIALAIVAVYLLGALAWSQVATIKEDLPTYSSRLGEVVDAVNTQVDNLEKKTLDLILPKNLLQQQQQIQQKPQQAQRARARRAGAAASVLAAQPPVIQEVRIHTEPRPVIGTVYGYLASYVHTLVMASFVPFLVYFMLSWRDHINRRFLLLFPGENRYIVGKSWSHIGDSTRAFVLGNFLLWVFLSSVSAIAFFFLGLPYWPLVGLLSAFFSLIPYVGLALSLVPPVLAAVAIPNKFKIVITAILITAAFHVISMNFLYAKIIGRRVRLNPLVVTIALMFWGLLWGAVGLILAIPITAGFKAVCDNVESLEALGRLLGED